jgi:glyoxylase-like metal-dependent hydrolase (beta-lactamase superfamily II)
VPSVHELAGGLWTWTSRHPDWSDDPHWGPEVRSYALRTDDAILLFDPIAPPQELTSRGNVEVVLTAEWHARDAKSIDAPIRGDDLPKDVNAQPGFFPGERTLWIPAHNALIAGDCLPDGGPIPDAWLESEWAKATRDEYNEKLRPLLDLPIELLLPTHGDPVTDDAADALRRALA